MASRLQQLGEIEEAIWAELESCVESRPRGDAPHEWRVAVLATIDEGSADARNIVLREVEARERQLVFYTDARSPKVRQIETAPQGSLILWSQTLAWQLRMQVRLAVQTSGLAVVDRGQHRDAPFVRRLVARAVLDARLELTPDGFLDLAELLQTRCHGTSPGAVCGIPR